MQDPIDCPDCSGKGYRDVATPEDVERAERDPYEWTARIVPTGREDCTNCRGTGKVDPTCL